MYLRGAVFLLVVFLLSFQYAFAGSRRRSNRAAIPLIFTCACPGYGPQQSASVLIPLDHDASDDSQ
jgi:hypothetical protein